MPVQNSDVARNFKLIADLLELREANEFRVRSYREAARTVRSLSKNVRDMVKNDADLTELPGIGDDLAGKIEELVETGSLEKLEELKEAVPVGLTDILGIEGLGPKKVKKLWETLGITSVEELEAAARDQKIQEVSGFGVKTEQKILDRIEQARGEENRTRLKEVEEIAEPLEEYLAALDEVARVELAGSYRRKKETVGDLDILVVSEAGATVAEYFTDYEDVREVLASGETKSSVVLKNGLQVDLRIIPRESYGAALLYFTGSKEHNVALRTLASEQDYKVNEYGVFDANDRKLAGETEAGIYELFDCPYILPELRENRGELEAARSDDLPELVELAEIKGDLQAHSTGSDGANTLREIAAAAKEYGYEYFAITDHTDYVSVTDGHTPEELEAQLAEIDEINEAFDDFVLLKSCEVDIKKNGELYLPDAVLAQLDMVVVAVHRYFDLPEAEQTDRITTALAHPLTDVLAHPTARRLPDRPPLNLNMEAVMDAALEHNSYLEINAQPDRLDLDDTHAKLARDKGLKVTISTDAHVTRNFDYMQYGVHQARRGWLETEDVLNTRPWAELKEYFGKD